MATGAVQDKLVVEPRTRLLGAPAVRAAVLSLLLATVTVIIYAPVHNHPFISLDDPRYVVNNTHISSGVSVHAVFWAFTHGYAGNWHPLTWISHALDIQMFGFDPSGHHDENVAWHVLDAVLLCWVLTRATGYPWRSFMVSALFAVHPVNVEAVAWVAERKTMLSTFFCLLALAAYRWYAAKPSPLRYGLMAGLFVLGLFSKPQIIMLPLVLLAWDYWPLQRMAPDQSLAESATPATSMPPRSPAALIKEKVPLFLICLIDAGLTLLAQHVNAQPQPYPLAVRLENALVSYTRYIQKAFWPSRLALYYPHPGRSLTLWQVGASFTILLLVTIVAARFRRHRYLIVGWLFFLIMLIPMIGLVQVDVQGMADRYAYVSYIGLFIMLCWGMGDLAAEHRWPRMLLPALSLATLAALVMLTHRQVGYWQDDLTLWRHATEVTQQNWKAEYMLGESQAAAGMQNEAMESWRRAAAINPNDPFINENIAVYEHKHNNLPLAITYYERVVANAWNPQQLTDALTYMAAAYRALGDTARAEECLKKLDALPRPQVDWQGAWWRQIIPYIRERLHLDGSRSQG